MEIKAMCSDKQNSEADVELELWSSLLHAEGVAHSWDGGESLAEEMFSVTEDPTIKAPYPWNPANPGTEEFFTQLEQGFGLDDWEAETVVARSTAFFSRVNQLWATTSLQETLVERFAARIPQHLLGTIAHRAQQALAASQSLADQLVQCVQDILPTLAEEDLQVLARPLAYAMRNGESRRAVDSTLSKVRIAAWEDLSDIEQARLSLIVARYALAELEVKSEE